MDLIFTTMKMSSVKEINHTGLCCAMKGYIVSQKKYSYFDPINLVVFGLEWGPSIAIGERSHMTSAAEGGGGFEMLTVADKGKGV